jgi:predicted DNA-binding protein
MASKTEKPQAATLVEQEIYDELIALSKRNERTVAAELRVAIQRHLEASRSLSHGGTA